MKTALSFIAWLQGVFMVTGVFMIVVDLFVVDRPADELSLFMLTFGMILILWVDRFCYEFLPWNKEPSHGH